MNRFISFICLLALPFFAFTQQNDVFYQNQLGYDLKPILFSISDADYDIFLEKELTYRRAFSKKDYLIAKLSLNGEFRADDFRAFNNTSDSTFITNRLFSYNNNSLSIGYTRKFSFHQISLYGGLLSTVTQEGGEAIVTEYKLTPQLEPLSENFRIINYYRVGLTPIVGIEFPITKHWSLLTNFYPTIDYTFGEWDITNANREIRTIPIATEFTFDWNLLQDISLLFSF